MYASVQFGLSSVGCVCKRENVMLLASHRSFTTKSPILMLESYAEAKASHLGSDVTRSLCVETCIPIAR